jgi:hypothetical protein
VVVAATMAVHYRRPDGTQPERSSLEILAQVLATTPSRQSAAVQLGHIANDMVSEYRFPTNAIPANASYQTFFETIDRSVEAVRIRPAMSASEVNQQSGRFYWGWFGAFYGGESPRIESIWPLLSFVLGSLPFGLQKINPLQMTIADWVELRQQQQIAWMRVVSLERLGFRGDAEQEAQKMPQPDSQDSANWQRAILQSIRQRGYQKTSVILVPLGIGSITESWLPSENTACWIGINDPQLNLVARYVLYEDASIKVDPEYMRKAFPNSRIAYFGNATLSTANGYPYISSPQSLDDLVERLDSTFRSASAV